MKKIKVISLLLALVACLGFVGTNSEVSYADGFTPYYTEVDGVGVQLSHYFNTVDIETSIQVAHATTSAEISLNILESSNGRSFYNVETLTASASGRSMHTVNSYRGIYDYYYKVTATVKIYDGNGDYIETVTATSNTVQLSK